MRPERRLKPGVDGGLRAASWVTLPKRRSARRVDWRSFRAKRANGKYGADQVSDRQPQVRKPATERLINLALGPNRTSQSVYQLVSYNLRTLDGRGRDLRISIAV